MIPHVVRCVIVDVVIKCDAWLMPNSLFVNHRISLTDP